jgi:hypothetical protein
MPYYAYVNGKATIGLATVDQMKDYVRKKYADYEEVEVAIYDMKWTSEGQQLVDQYTFRRHGLRGRKKKRQLQPKHGEA